MVEVFTVIGAIAACDQLINEFTATYRALRRAYKAIRYAKEDIEKIKTRTWIVLKVWRTFRELMTDVKKNKELSVDLKGYRSLNRKLKRQAEEVIAKIRAVLDDLDPLSANKQVPVSKQLYTKFKWFIRKKEEIQLLYVDMELLTGYMHVFVQLVQLRIAIQQYKLDKAAATKVQIDMLQRTVETQLQEIRQTILQTRQPIHSNESPVRSSEFLSQVRYIIRQELSQHTNNDDYDSSPSSHQSSSPRPDPSSDPTSPLPTPGDSGKTHESVIELIANPGPVPEPLPELNRQRSSSSNERHPISFFPMSEVSYVSIEEPVSPVQLKSFSSPTTTENEENTHSEGQYVATALYGPPTTRRRPPPARRSTSTII